MIAFTASGMTRTIRSSVWTIGELAGSRRLPVGASLPPVRCSSLPVFPPGPPVASAVAGAATIGAARPGAPGKPAGDEWGNRAARGMETKLVDPVTGVQSAPPAPTSFEPDIDIEILTGFTIDGGTGYYLTTGHDVVGATYPGGVVRVIPGGPATSTTGPSEFTTPVDVAVVPAPEPAAPLLLAAGAALLLALRRRAS